jgi:hypothetical protein
MLDFRTFRSSGHHPSYLPGARLAAACLFAITTYEACQYFNVCSVFLTCSSKSTETYTSKETCARMSVS